MCFLFFFIVCCTHLYGQENPDFPIFTCTVEQNLFEVNTPFAITYALYFEGESSSDFEANFWDDLNVSDEIRRNQISEENRREFKYLNGKSREGIVRSFRLEVKDTGVFIVPATSIEYKGITLTSEEVVLEIVAKDSRLTTLTPSELHSKVFVQLEFDKKNEASVIGDAIFINTVVYTQIDIENLFVEEDLGVVSKTYLQSINIYEDSKKVEFKGETYVRKIVKRHVFFPLETKEILISPAKVIISRIKNKANPYSIFGLNLFNDTLHSNSLTIKPTFLEEGSAAYAAKNGQEMKLSFNDSLINQGIILLDVDLIGTGNPLFYTAPNLDLGVRASIEVEYLGNEYLMETKSFRKSFRYVVSCHETGNFDLNLDWICWNTRTNKREVLSKLIKKISITKLKKKEKVLDIDKTTPETNIFKREVAFVVDCSISMLTKDFDSNRLQATQDLLQHLINQKSNTERFSIILMAGESFILCPLTFSNSHLSSSLKELEVERKLAYGTDITAGLIQGVLSLKESAKNQKDIIIITDGLSNMSYLAPELGLRLAKEHNIRLNTVCIGMKGEFLTPIAENKNGSFVYGKETFEFKEQEQEIMTDNRDGAYTRIDSPKQLKLDLNSLLSKNNSLLLDEKDLIEPELVDLLLLDASYRHQKTKKKCINIKDK